MGILDRIFRKANRRESGSALFMDQGSFTSWSGDAYSNDIYRAGVDAIARNCAKLKPSHVVKYSDGQRVEGDTRLNRILQIRPNSIMTSFDFQYKLITHYFLYNNAFAFIDRDDSGNILAIYPITFVNVQMMSDATGRLFVQFVLNSGETVILPYSQIIHLRRNFNSQDILGDGNGALIPALELAHTSNEGIINGIKSGALIRGILVYDQVMSDEKLKKSRDQFVSDYLSMSNQGGLVAVDKKMTYEPINNNPVLLDAEQNKQIREKIYNYLGISEKIVNSSYTEDEYSAFYESTIEPIATQLSQEFTSKIFTRREIAFGNEIVFGAGRLQFTSNATKVQLIKELLPMGLISINEGLEILNLPSIPDGDRRLQSLNYVNKDLADAYQLQMDKDSGKEVTEE